MKSSAYWANRANERMVGYIGGADKAADEVANAYWQASEYIKGETEQIFRGFYEAGVLSETQAKALLNQLPDDLTLETLKKGLAGIPEGKERQAALQLINSPAYAARIRRLEELQREIDAKINRVAQFEYKKSTEFYIDAIGEAYGRTAFDIQRGTGYGFTVSGLNEKQAAEILKHNWSGAHYSTRIWNNTGQLAGRIKQDILSGFLSGKSGVKTARQIQEDFSVGAMEARRLVRTETNYMANQAELASYRDCGIEQYEYLATLDMRTSTVCQGLDGKRFPIDKAVPGQNYPPMHPFCRSTTVAVIGDEETAGLERRARDPVTGKTYRVPADMTYAEWKEKYINQNPEARLALKKFENRYVDKDQYKRYKLIYGKETIPSFAKFQEIKYNNSEEWDRLKAAYRYINKHPGSDLRHYEIYTELLNSGIKIGAPVPPEKAKVYILEDTGSKEPTHIMQRMRERNITDDMVRSYVDEAVIMFSQWKGTRRAYYSLNGITVVTQLNDDWIAKTVWSKVDFDEATEFVLKVVQKHVK